MVTYCADNYSGRQINEFISDCGDSELTFTGVNGQRFIADGMRGKSVKIIGVAGNASGAYMDSGKLIIEGNAQDALGDTMNGGEIYVSGSSGDATGYAMRGGEIYIAGSVGYRAGIHMKEYGSDKPALIIGKTSGDFLGEYQAGGLIIVLNLDGGNKPLGDDYAAGMHGGKIVVFTDKKPASPAGVEVSEADGADRQEIEKYILRFCALTSASYDKIVSRTLYVLKPMGRNPYKRLYVNN